jgi:hypothetical protein
MLASWNGAQQLGLNGDREGLIQLHALKAFRVKQYAAIHGFALRAIIRNFIADESIVQ